MLCLETTDLCHRYSAGEAVLHDIALAVPHASIYGFLGPNGAGKTTTLRLLLGLIRKQRGTISIFGRHLDEHRVEILRQVGSLIETPSLYEHLTAAENLALLQRIHRVPAARIAEVLERVGLAATRDKRAGQFSLGMKQRLGIAAAMLHRPALLILDEPTNGLDPNGIIEMRDLLIALNREEGTTVLVSSHLLAEVERLVSHVGIVHRGRLLFQGTLDALRRESQSAAHVSLHTADDGHALRLLADAGVPARCGSAGLVLPAMPPPHIAAINRRLVEQGVEVYAIGAQGGDLESIFMNLIGSRAA
ncbi:ABC-2 type transport system ATP-binding protein [Tahibacter aquaticus]|uniref:ABC-2 type transport system ATP-binding protein n=1 Tax=Tahibacter aquaticus TaxID=520092 RepID=A0A4R6YUF3_9GAMM|nr:ABC transporter ATP-binding protein [Tahibacter aquaticus]TDR41982.1 ABC-2 type transport system ATP-binding protein [Tahibacter aquaticus]